MTSPSPPPAYHIVPQSSPPLPAYSYEPMLPVGSGGGGEKEKDGNLLQYQQQQQSYEMNINNNMNKDDNNLNNTNPLTNEFNSLKRTSVHERIRVMEQSPEKQLIRQKEFGINGGSGSTNHNNSKDSTPPGSSPLNNSSPISFSSHETFLSPRSQHLRRHGSMPSYHSNQNVNNQAVGSGTNGNGGGGGGGGGVHYSISHGNNASGVMKPTNASSTVTSSTTTTVPPGLAFRRLTAPPSFIQLPHTIPQIREQASAVMGEQQNIQTQQQQQQPQSSFTTTNVNTSSTCCPRHSQFVFHTSLPPVPAYTNCDKLYVSVDKPTILPSCIEDMISRVKAAGGVEMLSTIQAIAEARTPFLSRASSFAGGGGGNNTTNASPSPRTNPTTPFFGAMTPTVRQATPASMLLNAQMSPISASGSSYALGGNTPLLSPTEIQTPSIQAWLAEAEFAAEQEVASYQQTNSASVNGNGNGNGQNNTPQPQGSPISSTGHHHSRHSNYSNPNSSPSPSPVNMSSLYGGSSSSSAQQQQDRERMMREYTSTANMPSLSSSSTTSFSTTHTTSQMQGILENTPESRGGFNHARTLSVQVGSHGSTGNTTTPPKLLRDLSNNTNVSSPFPITSTGTPVQLHIFSPSFVGGTSSPGMGVTQAWNYAPVRTPPQQQQQQSHQGNTPTAGTATTVSPSPTAATVAAGSILSTPPPVSLYPTPTTPSIRGVVIDSAPNANSGERTNNNGSATPPGSSGGGGGHHTRNVSALRASFESGQLQQQQQQSPSTVSSGASPSPPSSSGGRAPPPVSPALHGLSQQHLGLASPSPLQLNATPPPLPSFTPRGHRKSATPLIGSNSSSATMQFAATSATTASSLLSPNAANMNVLPPSPMVKLDVLITNMPTQQQQQQRQMQTLLLNHSSELTRGTSDGNSSNQGTGLTPLLASPATPSSQTFGGGSSLAVPATPPPLPPFQPRVSSGNSNSTIVRTSSESSAPVTPLSPTRLLNRAQSNPPPWMRTPPTATPPSGSSNTFSPPIVPPLPPAALSSSSSPFPPLLSQLSSQSRLDAVQKQLDEAVQRQDFELCIQLRDMMRSLQQSSS